MVLGGALLWALLALLLGCDLSWPASSSAQLAAFVQPMHQVRAQRFTACDDQRCAFAPVLPRRRLLAPSQLPLAPPLGLEFPSSLASFFTALRRQQQDGGHVRVLHLGDSSIGLDLLPEATRARLQARFGDGGAGFVLPDHQPSYQHARVAMHAHGWHISSIVGDGRVDGAFGLGGRRFEGMPGARATWRARSDAGLEVVEFWYEAAPRRGSLMVRADGKVVARVTTNAPVKQESTSRLVLPPGTKQLDIVVEQGRVALYGAVFERQRSGLVWDAVSMVGAFIPRLLKLSPRHIAQHVAERQPDLLVLSFGGNDLRRFVTGTVDASGLAQELAHVIERLRAGRPQMACLVMGTVDHARSLTYRVQTQHVLALSGVQRGVAQLQGCAFFDTLAIMGGPGGIHRWRAHDPPLAAPDLKHLSRAGHQLVGEMLADALLEAYANHESRVGVGASSVPR